MSIAASVVQPGTAETMMYAGESRLLVVVITQDAAHGRSRATGIYGTCAVTVGDLCIRFGMHEARDAAYAVGAGTGIDDSAVGASVGTGFRIN